jgi:hypothetical protein
MFLVQAVLVIYNCISDEEESFLTWLQFELQKLAKSEEENFAGNYFKPHRASKLMEQAKQVQKCKKKSPTQTGNTELTHLISRYRRSVVKIENQCFNTLCCLLVQPLNKKIKVCRTAFKYHFSQVWPLSFKRPV